MADLAGQPDAGVDFSKILATLQGNLDAAYGILRAQGIGNTPRYRLVVVQQELSWLLKPYP